MPFFANQSREQLRQVYFDAWQKHCNRQPMQPLEVQIADVIAAHPEYQAMFASEQSLDKNWLPEGGATNPFLHMGLHLAVRDQIATDRPLGIRTVFQTLQARYGDAHQAEHQMIECLGEALWQAQRSGRPPDEQAYLESIRKRCT
ncbi:MAG: DUF1841 family protein [Steroidobacteraceae bacterium]